MNRRWVRYSLLSALLVFIGFYLYACVEVFFADSEIWPLSISRYFPVDFKWHGSFFYKPLFHSLLALVQSFDLTSVESLLAARLLFCLVFFGLLGVLYMFFREVLDGKLEALLALLVFVSLTTVMTRGYRIRSDILLAVFSYLSFYTLLTLQKRLERRVHIEWLALLLLMLFSTPKLVVFYILFLVLIFCLYKKGDKNFEYRRKLKKILTYTLAFPVVVAVISLVVIGFGAEPLYLSIQSAMAYIGQSFSGGEGTMATYFTAADFLHVSVFVRNNIIFVGAWIAANMVLTWKYKILKKEKCIVEVTVLSWASLSLFLLYPNKLPFFLITILPLQCLQVVCIFAAIYRNYFKKQHQVFFAGLMTVIFVGQFVNSWKHGKDLLTKNSNGLQRAAIVQIENLFDSRKVSSYFDSVGLVLKKSKPLGFLGPGQVEINRSHLRAIFGEVPEVILSTAKVKAKWSAIESLLNSQYLHIGHGVWVKRLPTPAAFTGESVVEVDSVRYRRIPVEELVKHLKSVVAGHLEKDKRGFRFNADTTNDLVDGENVLFVELKNGEKARYYKAFTEGLVLSSMNALLLPVGESLRLTDYQPFRLGHDQNLFELFYFDSYF